MGVFNFSFSMIVKSQPHATYSALIHAHVLATYMYLCRVTANIDRLLAPLDDVVRTEYLPTLTGRVTPNDLEHAMFLARHGDLGIRIPSKDVGSQWQ